MANYGVTQPNVTATNNAKLTDLINATIADVIAVKQLASSITLTSGASPYTYPTPFSSLPTQVQAKLTQYIPPGYSPPVTITLQELIDIEQGVTASLQALQQNPSTIPAAGSTISIQPVPSASSSTFSNILTAAAVIGTGALVVNALTNTVTSPAPATPPTTDYSGNPDTDAFVTPNNAGTIVATGTPVPQQTTSGYIDYRALYPDAQSDPYDETGKNLNPGWSTDEFNQPYWVGFGTANNPSSNAVGVQKAAAQSTATTQDSKSFQKAKDWRVRISLAPNSEYLYNAPSPGILAPLSGKTTTGTNGVIFPYTPNISVAYAASYDPTDIAHSNYKIFQYKSSSVDSISITGDFTAQDTNEANYLLAVIHFFRSVTKMFYGQDNNPKPGVPPPLCYLSGFGTYQFDNHPMVITNFTYTTPTDVDYIRAGSQTNMPGQSVAQQPNTVNTSSLAASAIRLLTSNLTPRLPNFQKQNSAINSDATYVPTKISIAITALPVVARNDISNRFSLEKYATGQLLQGSKNNGGGIW